MLIRLREYHLIKLNSAKKESVIWFSRRNETDCKFIE